MDLRLLSILLLILLPLLPHSARPPPLPHTHTHTRKPIQSAVPVDVDEFCFNSAS